MKKTLLTLCAVALLATPSLFAGENSLQQHLRMEQKLQKQYHQRLNEQNQYKYQKQNQYKYKGINPSRSNTGSMNRSMGGGGRH